MSSPADRNAVGAGGGGPAARQTDVEAVADAFQGERKYGRAANMPSSRPRKPTGEDMGPHNLGGRRSEAKGAAGMKRRRR